MEQYIFLFLFSDASSSDEVDDSDADPDFVPIGLIQKRKQTVSNPDDVIDTSDSENSPHVNESDQRQDLAADDTADDRIENSDVATDNHNDNVNRGTRKRRRNEASWVRNKKSIAYNTGKCKKLKGQERERAVKTGCTEKCRLQCKTKFSYDDRQKLCDEFWGMNSKLRRQDFIANNVTKIAKGRCTTTGPSKRKYTLKYFFSIAATPKIQVCQRFFLDTLDITERMVDYNMKKKNGDIPATIEKRDAKNKTSDETVAHIKAHINSFHKIESHYCRADTKREYLDPSLNIRQLHRLYQTKCETEGKSCVKEPIYRKIFNENFNLGFHVPSKDTCDLCTRQPLLQNPSPQDVEDHESHLRRKEQARRSKEEDKQNMSNEADYTVAEFDLQQVMVCPKINVASAYYLRKLNVYNFTVLDLQDSQGYCYCWNEYENNRGTNDIVSALWNWLQKQESKGLKKVIFYSDTCGGQNRNRIVLTAYLVFLENSSSIRCIEHKYFERGHSKMEADSMHSAISREFEHRNIYLPSGYMECMARANKKQPYKVSELNHGDVFDFESLNGQYVKKDAFSGIMKIHHIQCQKEKGDIIVRFAEEIGGEWEVKPFRKRGVATGCFKNVTIPKAYNKPCGIDKDKKADLAKLMQFIPNDCLHFFQTVTA